MSEQRDWLIHSRGSVEQIAALLGATTFANDKVTVVRYEVGATGRTREYSVRAQGGLLGVKSKLLGELEVTHYIHTTIASDEEVAAGRVHATVTTSLAAAEFVQAGVYCNISEYGYATWGEGVHLLQQDLADIANPQLMESTVERLKRQRNTIIAPLASALEERGIAYGHRTVPFSAV